MKRKVELLSPVGSFESLIGVLNAGADAVYLGGNKFGARAYAENFDDQQLLNAIDLTHFMSKKIYLTVNTMIKEKEFSSLYEYILPLYQEGLDAVIVQDIGLVSYLKLNFPKMEVHISTQAGVTDRYSAEFFKELGAERIVPARELSLKEIASIKENVDIDIESFVHGAMCYCYSGQCLFSSVIGGRSGNRGRCAQPCRLPYHTNHLNSSKEVYPLSLKDMNVIEMLPSLIESGIDSFKIEGRMKKPEYAAGVTGIYRKYIDLYYSNQESLSSHKWKIEENDLKLLSQLYIRSNVSTGYYNNRNSKDMITWNEPGYISSDDSILEKIREKYLSQKPKREIQAQGIFKLGLASKLILSDLNSNIEVIVEGDVVESAVNNPITKDGVLKQLNKTGETDLSFSKCAIELDDGVFLQNSALNRLRRSAVDSFSLKFLSMYKRLDEKSSFSEKKVQSNPWKEEYNKFLETDTSYEDSYERTGYSIHFENIEQLSFFIEKYIDRTDLPISYISISIFELMKKEVPPEIANGLPWPLFVSLPYIQRENEFTYYELFEDLLKRNFIHGALYRNVSQLYFLRKIQYKKPIISDQQIYTWNYNMMQMFPQNQILFSPSYELNFNELKSIFDDKMELTVYGRLPLMITANCLQKNSDKCTRTPGMTQIKDRTNTYFPVKNECSFCYNIIYNSVPLSLHTKMEQITRNQFKKFRILFTDESASQIAQVLDFYLNFMSHQKEKNNKNHGVAIPCSQYTKGHFDRGVL